MKFFFITFILFCSLIFNCEAVEMYRKTIKERAEYCKKLEHEGRIKEFNDFNCKVKIQQYYN